MNRSCPHGWNRVVHVFVEETIGPLPPIKVECIVTRTEEEKQALADILKLNNEEIIEEVEWVELSNS